MDDPNNEASQSSREQQPRIRLIDFKEGDQRPDLAVYVVDRSFTPLYTARVDPEGRFKLSDDALKNAAYIVVGPSTQHFADLDRHSLIQYRVGELQQMLRESPELEIAKRDWYRWLVIRRCVHGSVVHCYPYPWLINDLVLQALELPQLASVSTATDASAIDDDIQIPQAAPRAATQLNLRARIAAQDLQLARPIRPILLHRCEPVCDGIVEVYRRTCCCRPWIIDDPRLPELIRDLTALIPKLPPIKWPPIPEPDPPPFHALTFLKEGTLDETALNAQRDLDAIQRLPRAELAAYIQDRPYLWCRRSCSAPVKVAQGSIRPDGKFQICWSEGLRLQRPFCHDEYAYVVRQAFNGQTITIYNGVMGNKWFHYDEDAELVSYHPQAQGCRHNDFPGSGAFALLQDIGATGSYRLKTPAATGWDRVAAPAYNDGLADPEANPALALGQYKNRNWGGTLSLRYHFSEDMRGIGARYYRVSVSAADASGTPIGPRTYLSAPVAWKKYVSAGTDINVESQTLGPNTIGGENNLFVIPYDADADWHSGQYHAALNTRSFTDGRHLVTLEVFNNAGQRIRPNGASGPGIDAGFTFRRWHQEIGPTAPVPFAALTHMFWWDNRKAEAQIVDLRKNTIASSAQCQFLVGSDSATFSVGYRAYHEQNINPLFILNHSLWWRRGLGGPTGYLVSANPNNVGQPPNPPGISGSATFGDMLGTFMKCSFSLNLYVNVKTFNGFGTLSELDDWDYAAFALERTGP
jgi:hypothetical protein